jgi:CubicO group peptidase (beta-lactamase class C family)
MTDTLNGSLPSRTLIANEGPVRALEHVGVDLPPITALALEVTGWGPTTVGEVLQRNGALGLVVTVDGHLAHEWCANDAETATRYPCFSITKSFTGTLAAVATSAGLLDRSARVGGLLPELAATGFGDATVGDVADMTVALGYDEDYDDAAEPSREGAALGFGNYMAALGLADAPAGAPRTIRDLLRAIGPGHGPHGHTFTYATPVSDVLGWLLEQAHGRSYAELLGASIWTPLGAERDAVLSLDPAGTPLMGAGLSMTTRDLARFGILLDECQRGGPRAADGPIPPEVIDSMRAGSDPEVFARDGHYAYYTGYSYRDQWWVPGDAHRSLSAWGIHGQLLWVDPDAHIVIANHCGGPLASDPRRDLEQDAMCRAIVAASASWI